VKNKIKNCTARYETIRNGERGERVVVFASESEANGDFGMNRHRSRSGRRCLDETETVGRKLR